MEWGDLIVHYGAEIAMWADGLTKTDLMVLLGTFLLGQYMGSKRNVHTRAAEKRDHERGAGDPPKGAGSSGP